MSCVVTHEELERNHKKADAKMIEQVIYKYSIHTEINMLIHSPSQDADIVHFAVLLMQVFKEESLLIMPQETGRRSHN